MIYAAIFASLGWHTLCEAIPEGEMPLALIGVVCYLIGMIAGHIIEDRMNKKIQKLEEELRKEAK
jgi:hypothetical protein